jgi:hypothetical protein
MKFDGQPERAVRDRRISPFNRIEEQGSKPKSFVGS